MEENTLNKLTETYIKIRSKRTDLSSEFKKKDDDLKEQQEKIKAALLEYLKDNDINSVGTDAGMFYRSQKRRYWTSDWESMHKFILEHEAPEFLEKRLNQTAVKEFLEDNPELLPPGLNVQSEYTLSIRKNK